MNRQSSRGRSGAAVLVMSVLLLAACSDSDDVATGEALLRAQESLSTDGLGLLAEVQAEEAARQARAERRAKIAERRAKRRAEEVRRARSSCRDADNRELCVDLTLAGIDYGNLGNSSSGADGSCPPGRPVKGNHSYYGDWIYHLPGWTYYNATVPEACFATASDAERAGYRASYVQ